MFTADMERGSQGNEKKMRHESNREQAGRRGLQEGAQRWERSADTRPSPREARDGL